MDIEQKRNLVESYIHAYNAFDIEGMLLCLRDDVSFENISAGAVNATARGREQFRSLAEQSKTLFSKRKQIIENFAEKDGMLSADISFTATLAADLPTGEKAGDTIVLTGCSEFTFEDGKIASIRDMS